MALFDPIVLIAFFGGLALAFFIARGVRRVVDRRRARHAVSGPDVRSRQVRRAEKRQAKKQQKW